jgi:DNA-binding response OmpR family regulator
MIKLSPELKTCFINDVDAKLTKTEYILLEYLYNHPNKIYTRRELLEALWKTTISSRAIDVVVSRLRKKLGEEKNHIITKSGFGFGYI